MVTRWALDGANTLRERGTSVEELRATTSRHVLESKANAEHIVDWYVERVAGS
jgi:hypothetical protein